MRPTVTRALGLLTLSLALITARPVPAHAQLGITTSNTKLLILTPGAQRKQDSALAVQLGDAYRDRFDNKERLRLHVTPKSHICEVLTGSGFPCDVVLNEDDANRLARTIKVDAYITGTLAWTQRPVLHLHMVDIGRSGIAGWVTVPLDSGAKVEDMANVVADSLDQQLKAAENARDCYDRVNRSDFKGARERADRAFRQYPNQPAAAICLSRLFEATRQPVDSQIFALEKSVKGDSLNARAWEQLSQQYQEKGDTLRADSAAEHQLDATPNDLNLRQRVAAGWIIVKHYQHAVDIIDQGLKMNPVDQTSLRLKLQACTDGELWGCAITALSALYEVDSSLVSDSIFYTKIFSAAQTINDTAVMLKWSGLAVKNIPNSASLWRARAIALKTAGLGDSTVAAYERVVQLDSTDAGSMLAAAKGLADGMTIDTVAPLDTATLLKVERYLNRASQLLPDANSQHTIGLLYLSAGLRLAQAVHYSALSDSFLLKGVARVDSTDRVAVPAYFFLGVHTFQPGVITLSQRIQDLGTHKPPRAPTAAESAEACQLIPQMAEQVAKAKRYMTLGRSTSPPTATQILNYLGQIDKSVPQYQKFFKCS